MWSRVLLEKLSHSDSITHRHYRATNYIFLITQIYSYLYKTFILTKHFISIRGKAVQILSHSMRVVMTAHHIWIEMSDYFQFWYLCGKKLSCKNLERLSTSLRAQQQFFGKEVQSNSTLVLVTRQDNSTVNSWQGQTFSFYDIHTNSGRPPSLFSNG